ncbi:hypothetical protein [Burkholderia ubonensis]|uniref:hypothetical protein n=1 Tax=Burkholderia ubonensis TaxID=101571 RepID=UPI0007599CBE|nr:hypothetical protein [Burkholderia ubonensis]KWC67219.1 hypothetical protein WL54_03615 [Burkholderia ubonensis]
MDKDRITEYAKGWNAAQMNRALPADAGLIAAIGFRDVTQARPQRAKRRAAKAKEIPQRVEGWRFAGAAGRFTVWHAGKNDYRVTDGAQGEVVGTRDQFGLAHALARRLYDYARLHVEQ